MRATTLFCWRVGPVSSTRTLSCKWPNVRPPRKEFRHERPPGPCWRPAAAVPRSWGVACCACWKSATVRAVRLSRGGVFLLATTALLVVASSPFIHAVTNKKQGSGAAQQAAPPPTAVQSATLSRVFAAWQKRQEHVKSFHFVWDTRVTLPKGDEFQPFQIISPPAQVWPGTVPIVLDKTTEFTVSQTEWWGQGDDRLRFDFPIVKNVGANHWNQVARVRLIRDGSIRSRLTVPSSPAQTLDDDLAPCPRRIRYQGPLRNRGARRIGAARPI